MTRCCATGASVLSIDWTIDLPSYYDALPDKVSVQGNLDPLILSSTPDVVRRETTRLLQGMQGRHGHILNLGHGISALSEAGEHASALRYHR